MPVFGPITPGNKAWHVPELPHPAHDPAQARALLASIGLTDRNGDGRLEDAANRPARFTLLTAKGQTALERGVAVIRDELAKIGLTVDTVLLDGNALVGQFVSGKPYDAIYFSLIPSDTDPALNLDFWLSSGGSHFWNAGQETPATAWERQIDRAADEAGGVARRGRAPARSSPRPSGSSPSTSRCCTSRRRGSTWRPPRA